MDQTYKVIAKTTESVKNLQLREQMIAKVFAVRAKPIVQFYLQEENSVVFGCCDNLVLTFPFYLRNRLRNILIKAVLASK